MAILLSIAWLGGAHARRLDPALNGNDVHVCQGLLTTNGTCIGSESNVVPPSYEGTTIYRLHQRDRDDEQQDDDDDERD
jgi:hypothetical protein